MQIARWLHLLGVVVWVGGMFFAQMALRPGAQGLAPAQRLPMLERVLSHFLRWVAVAVVAILGSGGWMIVLAGGFGAVAPFVHLMTTLGVVMIAIFVFVAAVPFRALSQCVADGRLQDAGAAMGRIRMLIGVNLVLGLVTLTVAILGHVV